MLGRRSPVNAGGEGEELEIAWELRDREQRGGNEARSRARARKVFFKNRLWAHRTIYSACPVHTGQHIMIVRWTTGQGSPVADLRTPSRCTGHCTVQCLVHIGLSGGPRQREFWIFLGNFEPSPTYKHTKEHMLGHVLVPSHILSHFSKYCAIG
jgi:hypothetical protein